MTIYVLQMHESLPKVISQSINTTSRSKDFGKGLSPFLIGPCELYGGHVSLNMENAWQYSKVYKEYVSKNGEKYLQWAKKGWSKKWADRYPMGKGAVPLYSIWNGVKLNYIEARKQIYVPLYYEAVRKTRAWKKLKAFAIKNNFCLALRDFDGYNHIKLGQTLGDILNNPKRIMGHAFVLAMMLEKYKYYLILKGKGFE